VRKRRRTILPLRQTRLPRLWLGSKPRCGSGYSHDYEHERHHKQDCYPFHRSPPFARLRRPLDSASLTGCIIYSQTTSDSVGVLHHRPQSFLDLVGQCLVIWILAEVGVRRATRGMTTSITTLGERRGCHNDNHRQHQESDYENRKYALHSIHLLSPVPEANSFI
jgi:hypothetical protein